MNTISQIQELISSLQTMVDMPIPDMTENDMPNISITDLSLVPNVILDQIVLRIGESVIINEDGLYRNIMRSNTKIRWSRKALIVTNMCNIYYVDTTETYYSTTWPENMDMIAFLPCDNIYSDINNIAMSNILIHAIQNIPREFEECPTYDINTGMPVITGYEKTSFLRPNKTIQLHNTISHTDILQLYNFAKMMIQLNTNWYGNFRTDDELVADHMAAINTIEEQRTLITDLKDQNDKLLSNLYDSIPFDHRCNLCLGFSDNTHIIVPCGHTNICNKCIEVDMCPTCNGSIDTIVKKH